MLEQVQGYTETGFLEFRHAECRLYKWTVNFVFLQYYADLYRGKSSLKPMLHWPSYKGRSHHVRHSTLVYEVLRNLTGDRYEVLRLISILRNLILNKQSFIIGSKAFKDIKKTESYNICQNLQ